MAYDTSTGRREIPASSLKKSTAAGNGLDAAVELFMEMKAIGIGSISILNDEDKSTWARKAGLRVETGSVAVDGIGAFTGPLPFKLSDCWHCLWLNVKVLPIQWLEKLPGGTLLVLPPDCQVPSGAELYPFPTMASPARDFLLLVKRRRIDVIVPVYNAAKHTRACIASLKAAHESDPLLDVRYIVIDDASPDAAIPKLLTEIVPKDWIHVRNEGNLGFVKTANKGFRMDSKADVVIVNSDTKVPDGWLQRLAATAGEAADIATVTPVSNNASIYSWPKTSADKKIVDLEQAPAVLRAADISPVEIPVGVGFCCYIRRRALTEIGGFDEVFGIGYGEETDFCLKATARGYRHLLEPRIYVWHEGGASMNEVLGNQRKDNTFAPNEALVRHRHPTFLDQVHCYSVYKRESVDASLSAVYRQHRVSTQKHVLMISHKTLFTKHIGGVELHSQETIEGLRERFIFSWLSPRQSIGWRAVYDYNDMRLQADTAMLGTATGAENFLAQLAPDIIHVQQPFGIPTRFVEAANKLGIPIILSVHDYTLVCPRYNLLGRRGGYCGLPDLNSGEHAKCLQETMTNSKLAAVDLNNWRKQSQHLLASAALTIFVSDDLKQRVESVFRVGKAEVIGCGIPTTPEPVVTGTSVARPSNAGLSVCFLGASRMDKGSTFIADLVPQLIKRGIHCHFFGSRESAWSMLPDSRKITFHGRYRSNEVVPRLRSINPDVVCLLSPWPETFSRTLSEAWAAGIPALVSPLGAPAARVTATGAGWVLPSYEIDACVQELERISNDREGLHSAKDAARQTNPPSSEVTANALASLYDEFPLRDERPTFHLAPNRTVYTVPAEEPVTTPARRSKRKIETTLRLTLERYKEVGLAQTLKRPLLKIKKRLLSSLLRSRQRLRLSLDR